MRLQAADTAPVLLSNAGPVAQTKVLHIVSGLAVGGAERSLLRLCRTLTGFDCEVASLSPALDLAEEFPRKVWRYNLRQAPWRGVRELSALIRQTRDFAPDIIQGWMYHGNLVASLVARRANPTQSLPVIWSIRHSIDTLATEKPLLRGLIRLGGSRLFAPDRIVYNSHRGWQTHARLGYGHNPSLVVPNGIDTHHFQPPTPEQRAAARQRFGLVGDELALGCVARWHPQKGHSDLLTALAQSIHNTTPRLLLAGAGMTGDNPELSALLARTPVPGGVSALGVVDELRSLYWALDALVLPSRFGEGTANVLLEAQACGLSVVATDVGDAARLVTDPRFIATPADSAALSEALGNLLGLAAEQRLELGAKNAARVHKHYDLHDCLARYATVYDDLHCGGNA